MQKSIMRLILIQFITFSIAFSDPSMFGELEIKDIPVGNTVYLTAQGTAWNGINEGWSICTGSNYLIITLTGYSPFYLDFITNDQATQGPDGTIVHGKYKLQMGSNIVYIDWRDCDYQDLNGFGTNYNTADLMIRWNSVNNRFEHQDKLNQTIWHGISQDSTVGIWDGNRKNNSIPMLDHFQPTIPEGLTYSNTNNHPDIEWRRSEPYNGNVTYKVKRKNPNQSSYNVIANGLTDTSYIDTDVDICCGSQLVEYNYKIEAVSGDGNKTSGNSSPLSVRVKEGSTGKNKLFNSIPDQFSIQSFPNPFNPETTIKYDLPKVSEVQLVVYDLLGRNINTLKNQREDAGYYSIKWNGRDENGHPLSSGVYFINLSAHSLNSGETFTQSQKVVLLK